MNRLGCVIFDFGFTLCSDFYFNVAPPGCPQWHNVSQAVVFEDTRLVNRWMVGEIGLREIAQILSKPMGLDPETIVRYVELGCHQLRLNPAVLNFARMQKRLGRKIALVTVNMDVFSNVVVPSYHLDTLFDVIVNSYKYQELQKDRLWSAAFDQLGEGYGYSSSLLIDDSAAMVARFQELGGQAYRYTGDADFLAWLSTVGMDRET